MYTVTIFRPAGLTHDRYTVADVDGVVFIDFDTCQACCDWLSVHNVGPVGLDFLRGATLGSTLYLHVGPMAETEDIPA